MAIAMSHPPDADPRRWPRLNREARAGLLFVLPWLIFLVVFTAYPVLGTFTSPSPTTR